jgi:uncharacterized protein (TIGR03437 family)
MSTVAPGLFVGSEKDGLKYVAALHASYNPVLPSDPVKRGETVVIFGTGFGPTAPPRAAGRLVNENAPLANPIVARIGDALAEIQYAGLVGAGLYQFNITVPEQVAAGNQSVVIEIGGVQTQPGVVIPVQ